MSEEHWSARPEGGGRFAIWLIRTIGLRCGRPVARLCLYPITLYFFFRCTTGLETRRLVDHHGVLERHGFRLARVESSWRGLLASELWLRAEGAK